MRDIRTILPTTGQASHPPAVQSTRTAKAVMVLSVLGLICAGMNARMKLGTLREDKPTPCAAPYTMRQARYIVSSKGRSAEQGAQGAVRTRRCRTFPALPKASASVSVTGTAARRCTFVCSS